MSGPRWEVDAEHLGRDPYPLLNSVLAPRPVLWVATRSPAGVDNLAPFSWATVASTRPPVVAFTSTAGTQTLRNCRATGQFVLALPGDALLAQVNLTGVAFPESVSEFDAAGLTREPAVAVAAARVAEAPVAVECRVVDERTFGRGATSSTVVFGEVLHLAVDAGAVRDGLPDLEVVRPLTRLNRELWGTLGPLHVVRTLTLDDVLGRDDTGPGGPAGPD